MLDSDIPFFNLSKGKFSRRTTSWVYSGEEKIQHEGNGKYGEEIVCPPHNALHNTTDCLTSPNATIFELHFFFLNMFHKKNLHHDGMFSSYIG